MFIFDEIAKAIFTVYLGRTKYLLFNIYQSKIMKLKDREI